MNMRLRQRLALLLLTALVPAVAGAASVKTPHVEAELVARHVGFVPGKPIEAALRLKIKDHWHTYWRNPGDSGLPTKLAWQMPDGYKAGEIAWPYPKKLPLGPLMNFGYEGEVLHLVRIDTPAGPRTGGTAQFKAKADWLVCSDICIPESAELTLSLPARASLEVDPRWDAAFAAANAALPVPVQARTTATAGAGRLAIRIDVPAPGGFEFFPYQDGLIANAGKAAASSRDGASTIELPLADGVDRKIAQVDGILLAPGGWESAKGRPSIEISAPLQWTAGAPPSAQPASGPGNLGMAVLWGLIGGLILNLMPCVFPVLGIKVLSFVRAANGEVSSIRMQGVFFMVGVVLSFLALAGLLIALKAGGAKIGWGFQLQSPAFVAAMAILFLLLALNLAGLFEFGTTLQARAGDVAVSSEPRMGAFMSGVLAALVATPCTAPLMGAAIGFTLEKSVPETLLVFLSVGLGMALPVVLLSFQPQWLRKLPKPGAWMETTKQLFAFPMLTTVVWLVWVLGSQSGNDAVAQLLFGLVLVALAAWAYGRWQLRPHPGLLAMALVVVAGGLYLAWPTGNARPVSAPNEDWIPYSKERIAELRTQGKPVFVDFTATWCITCQVNKRVALERPEVRRRFQELGVARVRADWTVQDPVITAALAEFGRTGVPVYVYYPAK
ncbi:MAG TPA: protein-disulfide reductase DsbD domain-containing protein, partial [Usitatibacteraceae bacterium]|nr:protein-disulfide reductase DsbD domain-containing protein [Usitatibacteraceae bacterium]